MPEQRNAKELGQPIAESVASAISELPKHQAALKNFAGAAYFRTPGAQSAMREDLAAEVGKSVILETFEYNC